MESLKIAFAWADIETQRTIPEDFLMNNKDAGVLEISGFNGIQLHNSLRRFKHLKILRVVKCDLFEIPNEICELTELSELIFSQVTFSRDLLPLDGRLARLSTLRLYKCEFTCLPDSIGDIEQLLHLEFVYVTISRGLPAAIGRLARLKTLHLSRCDVGSLPGSIGDLEQLEDITFFGNNFSRGLPPEVGRLFRLKKLILGRCQLTTLPDSIGDMEQLEYLQLSWNNFSGGLTPAIGKLARLKTLHLRGCKLTALPESIGDLEMLQDLQLCENNFSGGLTPAIGRLLRLKILGLETCNLTTLPDKIADLQQLSYLYLIDNALQDYPRCTLNLKNLQILDISNYNSHGHNRIKQLPVELAFTNLCELRLTGNPITEPPSAIWEQGTDALKSFMRALFAGGALMHPDTLNLIGDTGAGKTSVAKSLVARKPCPTTRADRTQVLQQLRMTIDDCLGHSTIINDFGGHEIYHSVVPIFLPADGLVLLVLNINDEKHQEKIKKWLLTAIAKSKDVRVIIVGTHADQTDEQRSDIEERMSKISWSILSSAIDEVDAHISHLECQSDDVQSKLNNLYQLRINLHNADISAVVLSCLEREEGQSDAGLSRLHSLVVKSLGQPQIVPLRWYQVMKDILNYDAFCITMKDVENICAAHFNDEDDSEAKKTILRYLTKTSQIIWLENHKVLGAIVFHSPLKIINTCKSIMYHDSVLLSRLREHHASAVEEYEKGILTEPLLRRMLRGQEECESQRGRSDSQVFQHTYFDVVINFLQQFNLIACVKNDSKGQQFIIPCKLSSSSPTELNDLESKGNMCLNRVMVELSFIGSIVPMSFFETSVSSMLTVIDDMAQFYIWRDGLIILRDGVYLIAKRRDPIITLSAFSEPGDPSPWTLLHPVLQRLHENVTWSWHGASPRCAIVCPCCVRCIEQENFETQVGKIRTDLLTLATITAQGKARPTCKHCKNSIPRSLCFPSENSDTSDGTQIKIKEFFRKIDQRHRKASKNGSSLETKKLSQSELWKNLKSASAHIAEHLSDGELTVILQKLQSSAPQCIIAIEKEDVESEAGAIRRATKLLDILQKKSSSTIWTFALILGEIGRADLTDLLISGKTDGH